MIELKKIKKKQSLNKEEIDWMINTIEFFYEKLKMISVKSDTEQYNWRANVAYNALINMVRMRD